jgi:hypothetical protein
MHVVTAGKVRGPRVARRSGARFILGLTAALLAIGAGPVAAAHAELVITAPAADSYTNNIEPAIAGGITPLPEEVEFCAIQVKLYEGSEAVGTPVRELETEGCSWLTPPVAALSPGLYTAAASAFRWPAEAEEHSPPVSFTVDTTPPAIAITSPARTATTASGSIPVAGLSGSAAGDVPAVTVQVFSGAAAEGAPLEAIEVPARDGAWSGAIAGLAVGSYTLRAEQSDAAGNVGVSAPVALAVLAPSPPTAAFTSFPASPQVGEEVSLVSGSTDAESPITGFAWALGAAPLPFQSGRPTLTTSFATPGTHVVRLRVTDAAGRSSEVAQTITVRHHRATLMQPFPIVRIAGRETRRGARLTLLTVTAPVSSRVTVKVRGGGGRASSESRLATLRKPAASATVVMSFPRFARLLTAGSVLEVRVTKAGEIGKLTRFIPHTGKLPTRQDTCLGATGKPTRCPNA